MAKAKKGKEEAKIIKIAPAREQQIIETLETNYMPYAMSVIVSRAIPEIDGFKPSHRKLLYTMYKMGLLTGRLTKSANVVGTTMKLNPHGDMAIYETMVRLTEGHQALLHPFVESKGNFGRQYSRDMAFAASRYTEVKLSGVCNEIFRDIDKNTIDMVDNYDGSLKEPTLLPTSFPNVLVNPNQGIAVGMASNICSFNLSEICDAAIAVMKDADTDLTEILKAPDFSTGGDVVYNREQMSEIYKTGRGSFKIRGRYTYDKSSNCIDITEIPYTTTVEAIIEKIIELLKAGKLKEVSDIRDETDKMGLKITIDLKKGTDPEKLMAKIYKMTPLQDSFGCNFNILVEGSPMVLGVNDILCEWLRFRKNCIKRSLKFDIDKKSDKLHLLRGLEKILLDIDKAVKIVRETEEDEMVVPNLMKGFKIDEIQAEYVAEIKLRNLNKEYILKRTQEIENLEKEIAELNEILGSNAKIEKLIAKQLKEIAKKFGKERMTGIINEEDTQEVEVQEEVPDYPVKLFRTRENYLKKISLVSLRTSGEHKLKEDDEIIQEIECSNRAEVIFFSSSGEAYKIKVNDIPDTKASLLGDFIPNLLGMGSGETTLGMTATEDFAGWILFAFENGKIAKIPLKAYETKQNRKKLSNAFSDKSPVVKIHHILEECDMVIMSSIGKALVFNTSAIPEKTTKNSQGVAVMTPKKGSVVSELLLLSEAGIKNVSYYRTKNIPAKGSFLKEEDTGFEQMSLLDQ